jgi:TM2 domain-containing membrane protein YozV/DNA-directed RNA polymerase subunit M/transcription elongation factor TFIIS
VIRFSCPACDRVVEVSDSDAGLSMMCPTCGKSLRVPGSAPAPAAGRSDSSVTARPRLSAQAAPDKGMEAIADCPECGKALQVPPGDVGRRVACPRCAHQFIARGTGGAPAREEPREGRVPKEEDDRPPRERGREGDEDDRDRPSAKKYCSRCGAAMSKREKYCPECDAPQQEGRDPLLAEANSKKVTAGICALLCGSLGVHKFILGFTTAGVIMLLVSFLTCGVGAVVMHVISIVEGVTYLTKTDEEFRRIYLVEKKEWF